VRATFLASEITGGTCPGAILSFLISKKPVCGEIMLRRCIRTIIFSFLIGALVAVSAPHIIATCWHLSHRKVQQYGDYEISVPSGFVMLHKANRIQLYRAHTVVSLALYRLELIDLEAKPGVVDVNGWSAAATRDMSAQQYKSVTNFAFDIPGGVAACVQRSLDSASVPLTVLCRTSNGLVVQYFGDAEGGLRLRDILQGIRKRHV